MSDPSPLSELAEFVGKAKPPAEDKAPGRRAFKALSVRMMAKPQRRSVSELLGVVLVLSARTRRMVLPRVRTELDVFGPEGRRAVRLFMGPIG